MKKATSRDVAKLAGVSQTTVSFILNSTPGVSFSEETRRRVHEAAKQLNYVPNSFAKGLKTNESKLIGLLVPSMVNPFYPMLTQRIENYSALKGYNVLLCCTERLPEREVDYLNLLAEKLVDGIIYTFTPHYLKNAVRLSRQIPIVLIGEKEEEISLSTLSLNGFKCGALLAQHLLELGHRSIAYVMSPVKSVSYTRQRRLDGIKSKIQEFGLPEESLKVYTARPVSSDASDGLFEIDAGYQGAEYLLKNTDVTAIIGVNDMVAVGIVSCILNDGHYKVPDDISVCGFDNTFLSEMFRPKITTIDYCSPYLCKFAVDMLVESGVGEEGNVLKLENEPHLVVRSSTGPVKARSLRPDALKAVF
ncbi:MAG: LacI family DNA-binding transcriptional regulator [Bacillota bacterium]|nr:LacI family DNA-binding transcriptional regulator [Bacillota bacterium]